MTVAPYAGAWIEMVSALPSAVPQMSHPTRVRGLKYYPSPPFIYVTLSHPTRVRGLKFKLSKADYAKMSSRTLRGCVD